MSAQRPPCFECGRPSARRFYPVPRGRGGRRYVLLCRECFDKAQVTHSDLAREAIQEARARGVKFGRDPLPADELALRVVEMKRTMSLQAIADRLNEEGVPTLRGDGRAWTRSGVASLLRRKALKGD